MSQSNRPIYDFGPFRLDARKRLLLRADETIKLTPKAFETLLALVEGRARVLDRGELMQRVWPGTFVEDGNLTLNVSTLRKALGERPDQHEYIVTVPGQGYRFVADVKEGSDDALVNDGPEIVDARPDTDGVAAGVPSRRGRLGVVAAGLFVVVLAVAGRSVWFAQAQRRVIDTEVGPQRLALRRFATHGGVPIRVAISPDGQSLVYQQRVNGKDSLWLGQIETNESVPISSRTDLRYGEPTFSPDGLSVYFTVTDDTRSQPVLVRMPVTGGVMTELVSNVLSPVTFSPDGQWLAFIRAEAETRNTSIVLVTADGKNERTLLSRRWPEAFSAQGISWSPDGEAIVVGLTRVGRPQMLSAMRVADGSLQTIGVREWGWIGKFSWLRDGTGLVLVARENSVARRGYLWLVGYPSGNARKISDDVNLYLGNSLSVSANGTLAVLQGFIHSAIWVAATGDVKHAHRVFQGVAPRYEGVDGLAWTPDGRLLYTAYTGDNLSIWSMNTDGSDLRHLTNSGAAVVDSQIRVTSDGRYIVFQSNRSGELEIWRANADGTGLRQLTTGGGNSLPAVSPDGQWVIYSSIRTGTSTIWRTSIEGGATTPVTQQPSSWPDVSPDGKHIVYTAPAETPEGRLTIIPFAGGAPVKSFAVPRTGLTGRRVMRWTPDGKAIMYKDDLRGIWRQPMEGQKPQLVAGFEELLIHHMAWSPDGGLFAYTSGPTTQEIILIEHFK